MNPINKKYLVENEETYRRWRWPDWINGSIEETRQFGETLRLDADGKPIMLLRLSGTNIEFVLSGYDRRTIRSLLQNYVCDLAVPPLPDALEDPHRMVLFRFVFGTRWEAQHVRQCLIQDYADSFPSSYPKYFARRRSNRKAKKEKA
jgi:hypothetical protein